MSPRTHLLEGQDREVIAEFLRRHGLKPERMPLGSVSIHYRKEKPGVIVRYRELVFVGEAAPEGASFNTEGELTGPQRVAWIDDERPPFEVRSGMRWDHHPPDLCPRCLHDAKERVDAAIVELLTGWDEP